MKTIRFSTSLFAFLMILSSAFLTSCGTDELAPSQLAANSIQADLQQGAGPSDFDCFCTTPCNTFETSHAVDGFSSGSASYFDFQVTVFHTTECDASALVGKGCQLSSEYLLSFNEQSSNPLQFSDFQAFQVVDLNDQPMTYEINPQNTGFICTKSFTVNFKWSTANHDRPTPSDEEFSSGGLCIIGIINDPNGTDHDPSGETGGTSSGGSNG